MWGSFPATHQNPNVTLMMSQRLIRLWPNNCHQLMTWPHPWSGSDIGQCYTGGLVPPETCWIWSQIPISVWSIVSNTSVSSNQHGALHTILLAWQIVSAAGTHTTAALHKIYYPKNYLFHIKLQLLIFKFSIMLSLAHALKSDFWRPVFFNVKV